MSTSAVASAAVAAKIDQPRRRERNLKEESFVSSAMWARWYQSDRFRSLAKGSAMVFRRRAAGVAAMGVLTWALVGCGGDGETRTTESGGAVNRPATDGGNVSAPPTGEPDEGATGVAGVVTDAVSGRPVVGAAVMAASDDGQAATLLTGITDDDGGFFYPLAPGRWTLTVTAEGYRPSSQALTVTSSGQTRRDVTLQPE